MQSASATRIIHASPDVVWELVRDVTTIERWHPSVASVDLLSPQATGLHAARRCNFVDGTSVREEVFELEEGQRVRLSLSEFSMPMQKLEAEIRLVPAEGGRTQATFEIFFEPKFGILGKALGALAIRRKLASVCARILAGLDHHLSTGELVGDDFVASAA